MKKGSATPKKGAATTKNDVKNAKAKATKTEEKTAESVAKSDKATAAKPTTKKNTAVATAFSVFFMILAWADEAIGGFFYPFILIVGSLCVPTNEGNLIVNTPGFPLVLAGLGVAAALMLAGLILYHVKSKKKKSVKLPFVFLIVAAVLFVACFIGISSLFINKNGAISVDYRGDVRLTQAQLIWRHGIPVLIPLFVLFSFALKHVADERKLFNEAIAKIKADEKKGKKVSLD